MILLTGGVFAAETRNGSESSALINRQLENISESQGRDEAQKMLLQTFDTLSTGEMTQMQTNKAVGTSFPAQQNTMEFSPAAVMAFIGLALLLAALLYVGLVFWRRGGGEPSGAKKTVKRFSIE